MAQERMGEKSVAGNLVDDPKRVTTPAGRELVTMRLAENQRRFNREAQEWEDGETNFYDVAVDNARMGSNVEQSLSQGDHVRVTGNYSVEPFVTREGEPGLNRRIWAHDVAPSLRFNAAEIVPERDRAVEQSVEQQGPSAGVEQQVATHEAEKLRREAEQSWAAVQTQQQPPAPQQGPGVG